MNTEFDYAAAVKELEEIAAKVEDSQTGIDDIDRYAARAGELVAGCRAWLRGVQDKVSGMDD